MKSGQAHIASGQLEGRAGGLADARVVRSEVLAVPEGGDRFTANTVEAQDAVGLVPLDGVTVDGGSVRLSLPALSWAVVELEVAKA